MASKPGVLYTFPWHALGNAKYVLLAPLALHHVFEGLSDDVQGAFDDHMLLIVLLRYLQMFLWQFVSRFNPISARTKIQRKNIEFEQIDREENWDDYILLHAVLLSVLHRILPGFSGMPTFNWNGVLLMLLVHVGPIEFVYYWFHRALHHDYLWQRYHSHHHASFVTEAISGTVHPFLEQLAYTVIFSTAVLVPYLYGVHSIFIFYAYGLGFDFLNAVGHCNFEFFPSVFQLFPLKYLIYTPSFHSLHHSRVHTNYCLFMPIYDKFFGTYCSESEKVYYRVTSSKEKDVPSPDVIFLAHGGPLAQMLQIPFVSKYIGAKKFEMQLWMYPLLPVIMAIIPFMEFCIGHFENASAYVRRELSVTSTKRSLRAEQWAIARFAYHYVTKSHRASIVKLIEGAVLDADKKGCQVIGLGAFNKAWWINKGGDDIVKKYPDLRIRLVHGNTLTAACVLNALPHSARRVFFTGCTSKVGRALAVRLAVEGKTVIMRTDSQERFEMILEDVKRYDPEGSAHSNLVKAGSMEDGRNADVWLIGKYLKDKDHKYLPNNSLALYFCFPPPSFLRKDVTYVNVGALQAEPERFEGLGNCMADLDRGVLHACHAGAIVHCLEGWTHHETGDVEYKDLDKTWNAAKKYGFRLPEDSTRKITQYLHNHPRAGVPKVTSLELQAKIQSEYVKSTPSPTSSTNQHQKSTSASAHSASTSNGRQTSPDTHSSSGSSKINEAAPTGQSVSAMTLQELSTRVERDGQSLLVVDGWVLDVATFFEEHPGGEMIIQRYLGRDATNAVRGRVYNHSKAAFKIMQRRRIAKLLHNGEN
eukprot:CAMPEP_0114523174 /NCGR_PEP_ID=MMETSP0109-20121206/21149_1 /TAXON_ID=29199 /ORGANISM="Chlorarachnion reptans, Strain CCCM449" /LENGTH=812 /DNA_ID=CAMNT_0001704469 /DNA_START=365 /DNA_END=2803 /DNA_ORIENTATION=+